MGGHRQEEQENHNSSFRRIPIPNPQSPARLQSVTDTTPTLRTRANPSPQESSGPVHPFPTPSISVSRSSRAGIPSQNLKPAAPRPPTPAEAHLVAEAVTAGSSPWHPTTCPAERGPLSSKRAPSRGFPGSEEFSSTRGLRPSRGGRSRLFQRRCNGRRHPQGRSRRDAVRLIIAEEGHVCMLLTVCVCVCVIVSASVSTRVSMNTRASVSASACVSVRVRV